MKKFSFLIQKVDISTIDSSTVDVTNNELP